MLGDQVVPRKARLTGHMAEAIRRMIPIQPLPSKDVVYGEDMEPQGVWNPYTQGVTPFPRPWEYAVGGLGAGASPIRAGVVAAKLPTTPLGKEAFKVMTGAQRRAWKAFRRLKDIHSARKKAQDVVVTPEFMGENFAHMMGPEQTQYVTRSGGKDVARLWVQRNYKLKDPFSTQYAPRNVQFKPGYRVLLVETIHGTHPMKSARALKKMFSLAEAELGPYLGSMGYTEKGMRLFRQGVKTGKVAKAVAKKQEKLYRRVGPIKLPE